MPTLQEQTNRIKELDALVVKAQESNDPTDWKIYQSALEDFRQQNLDDFWKPIPGPKSQSILSLAERMKREALVGPVDQASLPVLYAWQDSVTVRRDELNNRLSEISGAIHRKHVKMETAD